MLADCYNAEANLEVTPEEVFKAIAPTLKPSGEIPCISFFKAPVKNITPRMEINILDVYKAIRNGYYKAKTNTLRSLENDEKRQGEFKASQLDYVTFSGTFHKRSEPNLKTHSGLICIDIDHIDFSKLQDLKAELKKEPFTILLFTSPRGNGLKLIVKISGITAETHKEAFEIVKIYIENKYSITVDKSGIDLSRACFLCYDSEAFINPNLFKNEL